MKNNTWEDILASAASFMFSAAAITALLLFGAALLRMAT